MNREIDVRHVLPAIRVPTLVIHGVEDKIVPLEAARWMTDQIPGARLVEVPGAGHLHFGRGTDAVNREVRALRRGVWELRALGHLRLRPRARDGALHRHRRLERAAG